MMIEDEIIEKVSNGDLYALLSICSKDELDNIVSIVTKPLSGLLDQEERYKDYEPDHTQYYSLIGDEIRLFGGDSFANMRRGGEGIPYDELVIDVCKRLKIPYENDNTVKNESNLLSLYHLERKKVSSNTTRVKTDIIKTVMLRAGLGPIGWLSVIPQLSGPAFRITVPCVIEIAFLRNNKINEYKEGTSEAETSPERPSNTQLLEQKSSFSIKNDENKLALSFAKIYSPSDSVNWQSIESNDDDISRLNPLLQAFSSVIPAFEVNSKNYMEVIINGPLVKAQEGGYRAFTTGSDGKIIEQATLFDPSDLSKIVNASALFQIASVAVAQKHLADISEKLSEIKSVVGKIDRYLQNKRKSAIIGSIDYFEQIAPSVIKGELSDAIRYQIEAEEIQLIKTQNHLISDIEFFNSNEELKDTDTFGSESIVNEVRSHQEEIDDLYKLLLLNIRARACGLQLLSCYPGNDDLIQSRKNHLNTSIQKLDENSELLESSNKAIQEKIKKISANFNTDTTLNKRKLKLIRKSQSIFSSINSERKEIEQGMRNIDNLSFERNNPIAKVILKVEDNEIVAINTA